MSSSCQRERGQPTNHRRSAIAHWDAFATSSHLHQQTCASNQFSQPPWNQLKEDLGASPAQLVYGTSLRIPGEFMYETPTTDLPPFLQELTSSMSNLRPTLTSDHNTRRVNYRAPQLDSVPFVFVRVDSVKTPLQSPYTGPHAVLRRGEKTFRVDFNGKPKEISVDRLKPAFMECTPGQQLPAPRTSPGRGNTPTSTPMSSSSPAGPTPPITTRSGRTVRQPIRLGAV